MSVHFVPGFDNPEPSDAVEDCTQKEGQTLESFDVPEDVGAGHLCAIFFL
jgi:hypothetical protein